MSISLGNSEHQELSLIAARHLRTAPAYWLLDLTGCIALVSRTQISGILPKCPPFITGGYWDDIVLAGTLVSHGGALAVLGAGIGSFIPLLHRCRLKIKLSCIEIEPEIALAARKFQRLLKVADDVDWIECSGMTLTREFWTRQDIVFLDMYKPDRIDLANLKPELHELLQYALPPEALVCANVYDQVFGDTLDCPTDIFVDIFMTYYRSVVILRHPTSSTLVASQQSLPVLLSRIEGGLSQFKRHIGVLKIDVLPGRPVGRYGNKNVQLLDKFLSLALQKTARGHFLEPGYGLAAEAARVISQLTPKDLLSASRRIDCSPFLGGPAYINDCPK